jgi:hypothetical protein
MGQAHGRISLSGSIALFRFSQFDRSILVGIWLQVRCVSHQFFKIDLKMFQFDKSSDKKLFKFENCSNLKIVQI